MKRGRDTFKKFTPIITMTVKIFNLMPKSILNKLLLMFQQIKGNKGLLIRYILLRCLCKSCGENVSLHPNVYILHPEKLSLGNNISIHPFCYIDAAGEIIIKSDVSVAHGVTILSSTHNYSDLTLPIKDQGMKKKKTIIEENVWIGAKTTILYGIKIYSGSIIGANSVVTKNVNSNSIVVGLPANCIRTRE